MKNKIITAFVLVVCATSVFAVQNINVNEINVVRIVVSKNDINMLSLQNDRIDSLALPSSVTVEQDQKSGAAYLTFKGSEIIKGFLVSEMGYKYQLEFVPTDISAENIVLADASTNKENFIATPGEYPQQLAQLLRAMYNKSDLDGYQIESDNKKTNINGKNFILENVYSGSMFFGQIFSYENDSEEVEELTESVFYQPGVRAVALDSKTLFPGSITKLYVIWSNR